MNKQMKEGREGGREEEEEKKREEGRKGRKEGRWEGERKKGGKEGTKGKGRREGHKMPQTHRHCCQETLWNISDNDTNQKNHSFQPMVLEDEGNDEEGNTQSNSHTSNNVNEMLNLNSNRCLAMPKSTSKNGNSSHHGVVCSLNGNSLACSLHAICGEKCQVLCLNRILVCAVRPTTLWFRFTSQGRVVNLGIRR